MAKQVSFNLDGKPHGTKQGIASHLPSKHGSIIFFKCLAILIMILHYFGLSIQGRFRLSFKREFIFCSRF